MNDARWLTTVGAASAALAVAAGAFGAHALEGAVSPDRLETWRTAASYELAHALALVVAGVWARARPNRLVGRAGWLFAAGTVLFSGSLYALVLLDAAWLGAVTPLGGLAFIAGWLTLAWAAWRDGPP